MNVEHLCCVCFKEPRLWNKRICEKCLSKWIQLHLTLVDAGLPEGKIKDRLLEMSEEDLLVPAFKS